MLAFPEGGRGTSAGVITARCGASRRQGTRDPAPDAGVRAGDAAARACRCGTRVSAVMSKREERQAAGTPHSAASCLVPLRHRAREDGAVAVAWPSGLEEVLRPCLMRGDDAGHPQEIFCALGHLHVCGWFAILSDMTLPWNPVPGPRRTPAEALELASGYYRRLPKGVWTSRVHLYAASSAAMARRAAELRGRLQSELHSPSGMGYACRMDAHTASVCRRCSRR